ncbi:MAG: hypothetical protein LC124_07130 [Ignavibacteriales bacterium]|nr:hypothetical protein [Ignavibacteriota bacterium]MCO6449118.1 hypothetical protein [Ignavibacterium album]MCZ2268613.1 hypothetical protein [Ignavibacteriales bacterium]HOJ06749.1 hypothetical protein [Ignavibacteriaceae bacterium]
MDLKNHLLYQEKFNVHSNLSSKLVSGSLTFTFDEGKGNNYFPNSIIANFNSIIYSFEGKQYNIPIEQKFLDILDKMKEERNKHDEKVKDAPINWAALTTDQVIIKFKEKGYNVSQKDDYKYEISKDFQLSNSSDNNFQVKMIFNSKSGLPESSKLYKDGKIVSENIFEVKDGKNIVHKKYYGVNSSRPNRNLIITKEY